MKKKIAVLPGDGIGPEVIREAIKICKAIGHKFGHEFLFNEGIVGAASIYKNGDPYPDETHDLCLNSDSVLFGAIGLPEFDNNPSAKVRPEQGLLKMRKKLGLFANIRPTFTFESLIENSPLKKNKIDGTDLIFVRELTGGIYFGERGRKNNGESAFDTCEYDREEIIRLAKKGFEIAGKRKKKLCCVDKANVLETSRLWRETIQAMENNYPSIEVSYELVDAVAMRLIQSPKNYDVLVTENLFGDILTDEASVISGSMGLMPSASIGELNSLYEPIHGSFPEATGKNIANPLATILSAAMMLEMSFDLKLESDLIKKSVERSIKEGFVTEDLSTGERYFSTSEVGDKICDYIKSS